MKPKIFIWIDSELTFFGLAYYIQQKLDCELYGIIDVTNKPKRFFQEQKLVKFEKIWFYFDHVRKHKDNPNVEYLSSFEQKYNINLWRLALNERVFYFYNKFYKFKQKEILSILEQECKLFETIIDEINPDYFITKNPIQHKDQLFTKICKKKGINVLILSLAAVGYKCKISEDPTKLEDHVNPIDKKITFAELQNYLKSLDKPAQLKSYREKFATSRYEQLKASTEYLFRDNDNLINTHYTYFGRNKVKVIFDSLKFTLQKKYRQDYMSKNLPITINSNVPLIYFPLHIEEEKVTLLYAPYYTNQLEVIRQIAKSLPIGYKLIVKDHPNSAIRGWRKISYYEEIMDIPNVLLVHPSVPVKEIISKCSLVVTIGSTSGLEAAFYGKPSIVLTALDFDILPSVHTVREIEKFPEIIRSSLEKKVNPSDVYKYIKLLEHNSFNFDYLAMQSKILDFFFFGGHLIDVHISISKMQQFLKNNESLLSQLALEFIKKLKV